MEQEGGAFKVKSAEWLMRRKTLFAGILDNGAILPME
jgi:hypothetical protein